MPPPSTRSNSENPVAILEMFSVPMSVIGLTADHAEVLKAVELHLDGMREEVRRLTVFHVLQNLSLFTASFKE